jgi:hypothetical protein
MKKLLEIRANGTLRPGAWSHAEDEALVKLIQEKKDRWGEIAAVINLSMHNGIKLRSGKQCKERWNNHLNPEINRGPWTRIEDISLLEKYKRYGNKWSQIAKKVDRRTESSVKNRIKSLLNRESQLVDGKDGESVIDALIMKFRMEVSSESNGEDGLAVSPASGSN